MANVLCDYLQLEQVLKGVDKSDAEAVYRFLMSNLNYRNTTIEGSRRRLLRAIAEYRSFEISDIENKLLDYLTEQINEAKSVGTTED
jgi:hypothetical protein